MIVYWAEFEAFKKTGAPNTNQELEIFQTFMWLLEPAQAAEVEGFPPSTNSALVAALTGSTLPQLSVLAAAESSADRAKLGRSPSARVFP